MFHIFLYKWNFQNLKTQKFAIKFFTTRICFNKLFQIRGNKTQGTWHLLLCKKNLCNVKKNWQNRTGRKRKKLRKTKNLDFQKNWWKMQTSINCIKQNNDQARIMRKIQFRSSFKQPRGWVEKKRCLHYASTHHARTSIEMVVLKEVELSVNIESISF